MLVLKQSLWYHLFMSDAFVVTGNTEVKTPRYRGENIQYSWNLCCSSVGNVLKWKQTKQLFSHSFVSDSATPWTVAREASLSFTISQNLFKRMSIESKMPSNHLILCWSLLLPSVFPRVRAFSNESVLCIRWRKFWSFRFSISPFNEYSGLISFRIDWCDLPAVHGTLKSLLQHHN